MAKTTPSGKAIPEEPEHLSCDVCLKEIPANVALTREGPDYIIHFCGTGCLDRWEKENHNLPGDEPEGAH